MECYSIQLICKTDYLIGTKYDACNDDGLWEAVNNIEIIDEIVCLLIYIKIYDIYIVELLAYSQISFIPTNTSRNV